MRAGVGRYPSPRDVQAGEGTSSLVNHAVIIGVVDVGNGHGGGGKAMYKKGPNAPPAAGGGGGAGSGHNHRKRQPHHHHHHSCSHDEVSAPAPSVESFGAVSNKPSGGGGLKISCCHLPKGGLRETSSNSVPDVMTLKTVCGVSGGGDGGGGGGGMTKSQDTLLRVAVPFRNNPVLKPASK